ncbi:DUF1269 domain-containing protein [Nostocoides sp. F2B08]|uniref:DUF6325 family protein n=1 Tax=Nostocoides sp. F2B08 TaxID=2653936 RepID=UPI0012636E51|nr:DUF6325 family protein [Tetrasphaera sp. F2B08]KAB7743034.1 DUF1269 domain-containing protein [Tetrasphaera sp. F2B08]
MSTTPEVHGPIDYVLIEFPADRLDGSAGSALVDLVESGVIRLLDLLVVSKSADGTVEALEVTDPTGPGAGFAYFAGARSGLLGEDDMHEAAGAMGAGTVAALIVYENSWAIPFVGAVQQNGGELIASARIPAPQVMAALEALEAED